MRKLLIAFLMMSMIPSAVFAEDFSFHDEVVVVAKEAPIQEDGKVVFHGSPGLVLLVVGVDGQSVQVQHNRQHGWVNQESLAHIDEVVDYFSNKVRLFPEEEVWRLGRAAVARRLLQFDLAIRDYDFLIKSNPTCARYHNRRGIVGIYKGQFDDAIRDLNRAIELDSEYVAAYCNRALAWIAKKEYGKAIEDCETAMRLDPEDADAYYNRSVARYLRGEKGEVEATREDLRRGIALDPRDSYRVSKLLALEHDGDDDKTHYYEHQPRLFGK